MRNGNMLENYSNRYTQPLCTLMVDCMNKASRVNKLKKKKIF